MTTNNEAAKPECVVLDEPSFEAFLCGIANEVFANVLAVRAACFRQKTLTRPTTSLFIGLRRRLAAATSTLKRATSGTPRGSLATFCMCSLHP